MKHINMSQGLLEKLHQIVPRNPLLAKIIKDTLVIEKEAVYRRLRGEVPFTLEEAAILADKLNFSLDMIMRRSGMQDGQTLLLELSPHGGLADLNYDSAERFLSVLEMIRADPPSERGEALTSLPFWLCYDYPALMQFMLFRWGHQRERRRISFDSISLPPRYAGIMRGINECLGSITSTYYVWNKSIIPNLVNEIRYFRSIDLMTAEDVSTLKSELLQFLHDLEKMASTGRLLNGENKFELYVASLNTVGTYSYMLSPSFGIAAMTMFIIQACGSANAELYNCIKSWVGSLKSSSTLISGVAERERMLFFRREREAVAMLEEEMMHV